MSKHRQSRFRFSFRTLIACITILTVGLGGWISYSRYNIQKLLELRQQGAIVIIRDRTPQILKRFGIQQLSPFFDVPTIELYITAVGDEAKVGDSDHLISRGNAEERILEQATTARSYSAEDIHLCLVDNFDVKWGIFAQRNSFLCISESKQRYLKRLRANQESGANINP